MKLSEAWLREWVDPPLSTEQLARRLTMAGLEVDSVEPAAPASEGVVVAEIRDVQPHPDAQRLSICRVFDGENELQVVCGAPNVAPGMKSALARVGAVLPGGLHIEQTQFRGQDSAGMLLSAAELGLGDDASGILELDPDLAPGIALGLALALDDCSIDIELTANRGDCLSIRGIARELKVLTESELTAPSCAPVEATVKDRFPVRLEDPAGCPRYLGRAIRNVDLSRRTPLWMQERLRRCGLRSIDPAVDVTNYVMLELGQPLHAFDLAILQREVVVRRARAGEQLELLDGRTVALDAETLLIADAGGPVAIAGVMGGERSGIQADTRDIFLECAFFAPLGVAGTARRYGLHTDASQRFERGVDYGIQHAAMERATRLLLDIVGGEPGPVVETGSEAHLPQAARVTLRHRRLRQLTGLDVDADTVTGILQRLELVIEEQRSDDAAGCVWSVRAPSHRFDIAIEEDLVEEVCRILGYDQIPVRAPATRLDLRAVPIASTPRRQIKQRLADLGYQEAVTYSFIDPRLADLLDPGREALVLANPMSQDQSVMRTSLLPGLVRALVANVNRQQARVRLFELGRCFVGGDTFAQRGEPFAQRGDTFAQRGDTFAQRGDTFAQRGDTFAQRGEPFAQRGELLAQRWTLGGAVFGARLPENWSHAPERADFFDLKGDVESLLVPTGHTFGFEPRQDPVLHPGQSATVVRNSQPVGRLGRLHPELEQAFELPGPVYVFELDAEAVEARAVPVFREVSRFPSVRRDLSLLVPEATTAAAVEQALRRALGPVLTEFRLFDLYQGEGIDSSKKSVAVGLTFQDPSRTLAESDINDLIDAAVSALETDLGARLR
jgi:phenylalanyl-tRNA synthetase beta chain